MESQFPYMSSYHKSWSWYRISKRTLGPITSLQTSYISITVHSFFINIFSCIATSNKQSFVWNFDICDLVVQMDQRIWPSKHFEYNLTGKIKRNTRSDAGRGSKQDVVCVTVSASLGGLCVDPIWWQTVLRMTPWEFPGNYYYLLPLLPLVCKALYCWMVFKWALLQWSGFQIAAIPASLWAHIPDLS